MATNTLYTLIDGTNVFFSAGSYPTRAAAAKAAKNLPFTPAALEIYKEQPGCWSFSGEK